MHIVGLSSESTGTEVLNECSGVLDIHKETQEDKVIALAGNPNVGKSTVFNSLTGMKQHTGNWPGKTVAVLWKVGGNPVKNNTYIILMAGIDKIFEILRCPIAAGWGIIARDLIAPGTVIGMLHNRKQF